MELHQLASFVHIVRLGSFSRASEYLHIAQPALSRKIRMLESELGGALLTRHGRGAIPTPAGRVLFKHAEKLMEGVKLAKLDLDRLVDSPTGVARLGIPPSVGDCITSDIFGELKRRLPRVSLQITEGWTGHLRELLVRDKIDFAVVSTAQVDRHMSHVPVVSELICLAQAADAAPLPRPFHLKLLAEIPLVLAPRPHGGRLAIENALKQYGVKPNIVLESEVWSVIKDVVKKGIACTLVPRREIRHEVEAGTLKAAPLINPEIPHCLVLARMAKKTIPSHMAEIFTYVAAHLRKALKP